MLKCLATLFAGLVSIVAIAGPAQAVGLDEARSNASRKAKLEVGYGDEAFAAAKWDEAIDHYTKAIDARTCSDDCPRVFFRRGVAYQKKQDCSHALADFAKAEETIKDNGELYFGEYICHTDANQEDLAFADINKAINVNPESVNYHYARCIIFFNRKDFAHALPDCEMTLGSAPDDQKMLYATAMSAEQTGDKAKAAKFYKHLLDLDHDNAQAKDGLNRTGG